MRKLLILFLAAALAGCAGGQNQGKNAKTPVHGIIFFALEQDLFNEKDRFVKVTWINENGTLIEFSGKEIHHLPEGKVTVFEKRLPAGKYSLNSYRIGYRENGAIHAYNLDSLLEADFTVEPGKIQYIGTFNTIALQKKDGVSRGAFRRDIPASAKLITILKDDRAYIDFFIEDRVKKTGWEAETKLMEFRDIILEYTKRKIENEKNNTAEPAK